MSAESGPDLISPSATPRLICDVTQSWSEVGGGVGTYLRRKRQHILDSTPHRHLMILPGGEDRVEEEGRATTVYLRSPNVPGNPNYRLLLRNRAVRAAMERYRPDIIECQDSYNLPWAAIGHRKRRPETALVAGYFTDFPTVYVKRPLSKGIGDTLASAASRLGYRYCGALYRRFDAVFALSENGGATRLREYGVGEVDIVPLGVELGGFGPERRDPELRRSLGIADEEPLLIYVGRLDIEKNSRMVVDAFRKLPESLGARLVLLGEGPHRSEFEALADPRIKTPGFVRDRTELARWLASADLYVTAFAQETFGVSIIEAQASGLPVIGVAGGALIDRVDESNGRLGPVNDSAAMARNILDVWNGDRAVMATSAQREAEQYGWDSSMNALFGHCYPAALRQASARIAGAASPARAPLASA